MKFEELEDAHLKGDKSCEACWMSYPKPCDCGGLMYAEFFEESWDGYMLTTICDLCGEDES